VAYELIKDVEPTSAQEYILKAIANAVIGQERSSVSYSINTCYINNNIVALLER